MDGCSDDEPAVVARSPKSPVVVAADGTLVPVLDLEARHVSVRQVARALAYRHRWSGCTPHFYSVAEHCLSGARYFSARGHKDLALAFLLHDVGEALLPDLPAPLRPLVKVGDESFDALERRHREVILCALAAPWGVERLIDGQEVRRMDASIALLERDVLMPDCEKPWPLDFIAKPAVGVTVTLGRAPDRVADEWERMLRVLTEEVLSW